MTANFEDLRQSDGWAEYIRALGWRVEECEVQSSTPKQSKLATGQEFKIFIRELPLIGSVAKIQRPSVIPPIEEIDRIAKKYRALFIKIEPGLGLNQELRMSASGDSSNLKNQGWEADNWSLAPTRTIHLDLTPTEEEIFAKFSKDARYSVRRAERGGVTVCHSEGALATEESLNSFEKSDIRQGFFADAQNDGGLKKFYNLLKETGKRKKFWVAPFKDLQAKAEAFKDKSALILAYHKEQAVAGALILFHDQVAYYHQAASNLEGRKLLAPYLVVWEAIKLAKKRDCHTLDLEGIYDPRYKIYKRFRKIGIFKKKFGGKEIEYPGSFVRYYNPIIKLIFKLTSRASF